MTHGSWRHSSSPGKFLFTFLPMGKTPIRGWNSLFRPISRQSSKFTKFISYCEDQLALFYCRIKKGKRISSSMIFCKHVFACFFRDKGENLELFLCCSFCKIFVFCRRAFLWTLKTVFWIQTHSLGIREEREGERRASVARTKQPPQFPLQR